jgi:uncharacterized membrane protein
VGGAPAHRLRLIALVVLLVALAAGAGLRLYAQHGSPNVQHDEAWSYASAAGRLGPFIAAMDGSRSGSLTGRWAPASQWQPFWTSVGLAHWGTIASDLSTHDVHPPLYFVLLHDWLSVVGQTVMTGRALNLVFAALCTLGIFGLARSLGLDELEGALVALVWALSPAVVGISSIARQYDLVALTAVLLVWGLVVAVKAWPGGGEAAGRRARWPSLVWLGAATAAALLTHYQAVLLLAGATVFVLAGPVLPGRLRRRGRWWPPLVALAAGTAAAALLAPGWRTAFGNEGGKLRHFSARVFRDKLDSIVQTLARFTGLPAWAFALAAVAVVVLLVVLLAMPRTRRTLLERVRTARPGWWIVLYFAVVTAGAICLQNLLFLSMPPLLTSRYLAMAWPFLAFLPLLLFGLWPRGRCALTAAFCLLVLLPATLASPLPVSSSDRLRMGELDRAGAVLIDDVGVGELPRFLWGVPGAAQVFADTQEGLLADPRAWKDLAARDAGGTAYYVSIVRGGNLPRQRDDIVAALRRTHDVRIVSRKGPATIYAVTPKATQ